jgi:hypothetical protein
MDLPDPVLVPQLQAQVASKLQIGQYEYRVMIQDPARLEWLLAEPRSRIRPQVPRSLQGGPEASAGSRFYARPLVMATRTLRAQSGISTKEGAFLAHAWVWWEWAEVSLKVDVDFLLGGAQSDERSTALTQCASYEPANHALCEAAGRRQLHLA